MKNTPGMLDVLKKIVVMYEDNPDDLETMDKCVKLAKAAIDESAGKAEPVSKKVEKAWTYNAYSGGIREEGDPDDNPIIAICYGDPDGTGANAAARICKCVNQHDQLVAALANLVARAESKEFGMDQSCTHDGLANCDALAHARKALIDADKP